MNADFLIIDNILPLGGVQDAAFTPSFESSAKNLFSVQIADASAKAGNTINDGSNDKFVKVSSEKPTHSVTDRKDVEHSIKGNDRPKSHTHNSAEASSDRSTKNKPTEEAKAPVCDASNIVQSKTGTSTVTVTEQTSGSTGGKSVLITTLEQCVGENLLIKANKVKSDTEAVTEQPKNVADKHAQNDILDTITGVQKLAEHGGSAMKISAGRNSSFWGSANETLLQDQGKNNIAGPGQRASDVNLQNAQAQVSENHPRNPLFKLLQSASSTGETVRGENARSHSVMSSAGINNSSTVLNELLSRYSANNSSVMQTRMFGVETQGQNNGSPGKGPGSDMQQSSSGSQLPAGLLEQSVNPAKYAGTNSPLQQNMHSGSASDVSRQILDSIQSSLASRGLNDQITVRLNPPELGEVVIKFHGRETQITGLLEFSNTQTRTEVEQALPQIVRNLADSGIEIKRLEVMLSDSAQSENQAQREQSLLNSEQQQHNWNHQGNYPSITDIAGQDGWLNYNISYPDNNVMYDLSMADNSINILL